VITVTCLPPSIRPLTTFEALVLAPPVSGGKYWLMTQILKVSTLLGLLSIRVGVFALGYNLGYSNFLRHPFVLLF